MQGTRLLFSMFTGGGGGYKYVLMYVCMHVQVTGQPQGHTPCFLTGSLLSLKACMLGQAGRLVNLRNLPSSAPQHQGDTVRACPAVFA